MKNKNLIGLIGAFLLLGTTTIFLIKEVSATYQVPDLPNSPEDGSCSLPACGDGEIETGGYMADPVSGGVRYGKTCMNSNGESTVYFC